jgi:hypothetical protein
LGVGFVVQVELLPVALEKFFELALWRATVRVSRL